MPKIKRSSLMTLEAYAKARKEFRAAVIAHRKSRTVHLGEHVTLIFEDELTMRYQIQEMLRTERIFEEQAIQEELDAYNPLVPDGSNWKVTMMIEYENVEERRVMLSRLRGIEDQIWVQVDGAERVYAVADEDLERSSEGKTAAVHFLRFELTPAMIKLLHKNAVLRMGVDHPAYTASIAEVGEIIRVSLLQDLNA
jgi:hypothetical protein